MNYFSILFLQDLQDKINGYETQIVILQQEIDSLKNENSKLNEERTDQFSEFERLQYLKSQNETLSHELEESNQKKLEMKFRIEKFQKEISDLKGENCQIELVDELKSKIAKFSEERAMDSDLLMEQEKMMKNLKLEIEALKRALHESESAREDLTAEYNDAQKEIESLRKRLGFVKPKKDFKEFVVLKRELNALKDENSDLKQLARTAAHSSNSLPLLKYEPQGVKSSANIERDANGNRTRKKSKSKSPIQI